jgi:hypothetical protein
MVMIDTEGDLTQVRLSSNGHMGYSGEMKKPTHLTHTHRHTHPLSRSQAHTHVRPAELYSTGRVPSHFAWVCTVKV